MQYRPLGTTGIRVSEIGFGAWGIGGNVKGAVAYGPTDDEESKKALRHAFERGVTFFDTADFYGYGHSEEVLGAGLAGVRSQVIIATKVGMLDAAGAQDFSVGHIRRCVEQSLRRLGTDYIDLYQLHSPPVDLIENDGTILECMESLQRAGKIRAFGVSVRSPEDGLRAAKLGFKCLQVNFNMLDQRAAENGLFERCQERGVGVIGRTPLCFGFLTGHYSSRDKFAPDDHRNRWKPEQRDKWAGAYPLFLSALQDAGAQTPAQFALRFCLSFPAISSVIPGMLNTTHVDDNTRASELGGLRESERAQIMEIYREHDFFLGP
jgi:aryl-alcohol dehydrogenase-like predicted oxidoreductase